MELVDIRVLEALAEEHRSSSLLWGTKLSNVERRAISSAVERCFYTADVVGSIPTLPTIFKIRLEAINLV